SYGALRGGDVEVIAYLIEHGADPRAASRSGWTPLHGAAQVPDGGTDVVKLLLDHGAAVDARDASGWTPLHIAPRQDAAGAIRALLARGASLEARTAVARTVLSKSYPASSTPLDVARAAGAKRAVALLQK